MCILHRDKHPPKVFEIPCMQSSQILSKAKQALFNITQSYSILLIAYSAIMMGESASF